MWSDRRTIMTLASSVVIAGIGFLGLSWPNYRSAGAIQDEIGSVRLRIANEQTQSALLKELARELAERRSWVREHLRNIPSETDMASLITALTIEADGVNVLDQTFTRGKIRPLQNLEQDSLYALPLSVDMDARFDVVFELIERVEAMGDLVRIAAVQVRRHDDQADLVRATVTLEAIFEVPTPKGAGV